MKKSATTHKPSAGKRDAGASKGADTKRQGKDAGDTRQGKSDSATRQPEKMDKHDRNERSDAMRHDGSAGAFDATEHSHDDDEDGPDNDDFAMDR